MAGSACNVREVIMPWNGKRMGTAYLLITIGSSIQFWFPDVVWVLIPLAALLFGFALEQD